MRYTTVVMPLSKPSVCCRLSTVRQGSGDGVEAGEGGGGGEDGDEATEHNADGDTVAGGSGLRV